ncbi:MAG: hypothetical protein R6W90_02610 [Ignavibacteriaceae bacterium]
MFNKIKSYAIWAKLTKQSVIIAFAITTFSFSGCILDAFDTLTQEIPYSMDVVVSGDGTNVEGTVTVNLNDNDFYSKNQSKINNIELVKIAYKTKSVVPADLSGNVTITVRQSNGTLIFQKNIPGARPSDYSVNPYELTLTQAEIQLANLYLSNLSNRQFTATVTINTSTSGTKTLEAQVFVVFEMEYDL